jgi:hypothetical protein
MQVQKIATPRGEEMAILSTQEFEDLLADEETH